MEKRKSDEFSFSQHDFYFKNYQEKNQVKTTKNFFIKKGSSIKKKREENKFTIQRDNNSIINYSNLQPYKNSFIKILAPDVQKNATIYKKRKQNNQNSGSRQEPYLIKNQLIKPRAIYKSKNKQETQKKFYKQFAPYVRDIEALKAVFQHQKPVKGPPQNLINSTQKYKQILLQNVEYVMKNLKVDSFEHKMQQFAIRLGLDKNAKIYINNSKQNYIRRLLNSWGWIQNKNRESDFFHLKWVYSDTPQDYKNLQLGQFFNHFEKNQQLTNKNFLQKNIRKYKNQHGHITNSIMPECFDLYTQQQCKQFDQEFQKQLILSFLKKFIKKLKLKRWKYFQRIIKNKLIVDQGLSCSFMKNKLQKHISQSTRNSFFYAQVMDPQLIYPIQYLVLICKYLQQLKFKCLNSVQFDYYGIFQFKNKQWNKFRYQIYRYIQEDKQLLIKQTPSNFLIVQLVKFYIFFSTFFRKQWQAYGMNNLWIVKPVGISRGNGIIIYKQKQKLIQSAMKSGKLIQKYIECPLIFKQVKNKQLNHIIQRKFDIRQWVLVKNLKNLEIYKFKKFYIRLCSEKYFVNQFQNTKQHLTNYSQNKFFFQKKQDSVLSYQEFSTLFSQDQIGGIQIKINKIIIQTLKMTKNSINHRPSSFQLYGFDIIIDQNKEPWLLEVNLSPACQQRTVWMSKYLDEMSQGLFHLILPRNLLPEHQYTQNNWKLILNQKYMNKRLCQNTIIENIQQKWTEDEINKLKKIQKFYKIRLYRKMIINKQLIMN